MYNSLQINFDMYNKIKTFRQTSPPIKLKVHANPLQGSISQLEPKEEEKEEEKEEKEEEKEEKEEEEEKEKETLLISKDINSNLISHLLKDNTNIKFCFIISSYNNSLNIEKNLYSVINQTYTNWRAIYINDNSSDETEELYFEIIKNTKM